MELQKRVGKLPRELSAYGQLAAYMGVCGMCQYVRAYGWCRRICFRGVDLML